MEFTYETTDRDNHFIVTVMQDGKVIHHGLFVTGQTGAAAIAGMVDDLFKQQSGGDE